MAEYQLRAPLELEGELRILWNGLLCASYCRPRVHHDEERPICQGHFFLASLRLRESCSFRAPSLLVHVLSALSLHGPDDIAAASAVCHSWHERVVASSQVDEDPGT